MRRSTAPQVEPPARDGRDVRWEAHRTRRRRQLVEAALRAIRRYGAGVGMDEIAAEAGTSKTVLYRHLGDRAGLYRAVVAAVDATILEEIAAVRAAEGTGDVVDRIAAMATAYLSMVERDPEIYRFVMSRPLDTGSGPEDPVHRITAQIADQLTPLIQEHLEQLGTPSAATLAPIWGHGIVGLVQSAADHWLARSSDGDHAAQVDPDEDDITTIPTTTEVSAALVTLLAPGLGRTPTARHTRSDNDEDAR